MSAEIIMFVPRPNPDRAKREAEVQQQAADLMHQVLFGAPLYADMNEVILDRIRGVPANVGPQESSEGYPYAAPVDDPA